MAGQKPAVQRQGLGVRHVDPCFKSCSNKLLEVRRQAPWAAGCTVQMQLLECPECVQLSRRVRRVRLQNNGMDLSGMVIITEVV
jgi:hypothetical protein